MIKEKDGVDHYLEAKNLNNWKNKLDKFRLEKSINWNLAIVKEIDKFSIKIETEKKLSGVIKYENISWTKKEFNELIKSRRYNLCRKYK